MSSPRRLPHIPALDGLRSLAVLWVLGVHLLYGIPQGAPGWGVLSHLVTGYLGVDVFFVLSGFLITTLLLDERARTGKISYRSFMRRRAARLLPALFVLVAVGVVVAEARPSVPELSDFGAAGTAALGGYANWYQLLAAPFASNVLSHTWSLGIEWQFYATWPFIVTGLLAAFGRRAWAVAALAALGSTQVMAILGLWGHDGRVLYLHTATRTANLAIGAALAFAVFAGYVRPTPRQRVAWRWAARVGAAVIVAVIIGGDRNRTLWEAGLFTWIGLATAAIIGWALVDVERRSAVRSLLESPLAGAFARISYGLYLWHWPVCAIVSASWFGGHVGAVLGLRVAASLVLALLSWWLVEQPFLRLERSLSSGDQAARTARATRSVPNAVRIAR